MPIGPSQRMRDLAARWLVDQVTVQTRTHAAATRGTMSGAGVTLGTAVTYPALVRAQVLDVDAPDVDRAVRDLSVWLPEDATVTAGMLVTIVDAQDQSLIGEAGPVITVERDSLRAVRRCLVRLGNDA